MRSAFALWHSAMWLFFVTYTASASGLVFLAFSDFTMFGRTNLSYASLSLGAACIGPFVVSFIGPEKIRLSHRRMMNVASGLLVINAFLMPLFGSTFPYVVRPVYHAAFLPAGAIFLTVLGTMLWRGDPSARWIAVAWAAPTVFALERTLRGLDLYQVPYQWDYFFYIGLAYMAVVMALAVSRRVSDIRHERDLALAKEQEMGKKAHTDSLTGLPNRRAFDAREWRDGDFLAILDVDRFKQINDDFGHQLGDDVLRAIGDGLSTAVNDGRVLAAWRLGGEEFAVLCEADDVTTASVRINQLRGQLSGGIASRVAGVQRPVTLSVGLARIADGGVAGSYHAADKALYSSKAEGRDRLSYTEVPAPPERAAA